MASNYTQILRNLFFDIAYQTGISSPFRSMLVKNKNIIVLICHRVSDISDDIEQMRPPMPVASFRLLMEQLAKTFRIIDINDIKKLPDNSGPPFLVLTFDDGYKDFIENAVPILLDLGIPATQSICPLLVDKETPPWTQVLEVCLNSMEADLGVVPSLQYKYLKLPDGSSFEISKPLARKTFMELCDQLFFENDETSKKLLHYFTEIVASLKAVNEVEGEGWVVSEDEEEEDLNFGEDVMMLNGAVANLEVAE